MEWFGFVGILKVSFKQPARICFTWFHVSDELVDILMTEVVKCIQVLIHHLDLLKF